MSLGFGGDQILLVILIETNPGNRNAKKFLINWASADYIVRMVSVLVLKGFSPCLALLF
jgi:hypothetical protein